LAQLLFLGRDKGTTSEEIPAFVTLIREGPTDIVRVHRMPKWRFGSQRQSHAALSMALGFSGTAFKMPPALAGRYQKAKRSI
jgi:hypothetical protein